MRSMQAFTSEVDDIALAIDELKSGIDSSYLLKNSCGIVFCGFEPNMKALVKGLSESFDFPFIGCTGVGILSTGGYSQSSISMLVMTADDVEFSIGLTDEINGPEDVEKIADTYRDCVGRLSGKDKLIFAYVPWFNNILINDIVDVLDEASGHVPIYGGVASDGWSFDATYVFTDKEASQKKCVIMTMAGNVNPIFAVEHSTTLTSNLHKVATKAEGNVVYEIDRKPATEFIEELGLITDESDVILNYLGTPFLASQKTRDDDEIETLNCLCTIDHEQGSCGFIGRIEEGTEINMVLISKGDIEHSIKTAFDQVLDVVGSSKDYKYSTIICSSCAARYCLLVADKNAEGRAYEGRLPEGVEVQGVYVYGEICPHRGKKNNGLYNALSNETFTILAL